MILRIAVLLLAVAGAPSPAFAQEKARETTKTVLLSQERDAECIQVMIDAAWAMIEVSVKRLRRIAESAGPDGLRAKRLVQEYELSPRRSGCLLLFNIWNVAAVAESGYLVGDLLEKGEALVLVDQRPEREIVVREVNSEVNRMKLFNLKDGRGFYGYTTWIR